MKAKILLWIIVMVCLAVSASAGIIINQTFEDNNISRWSCEAGGNVSLNTTNPLTGLVSGWAYSNNGGNLCSYEYSAPQSTNYTANFQVRVYGAGLTDIYYGLSEIKTLFGNDISFKCDDTGPWQYYNGAAWLNIGINCVNDTTYNISILHHSFGADSKADFRFDGVSILNNTESRGLVPSPQYFTTSSQAITIKALVDNICFCSGNWNTSCCAAGGGGAPASITVNYTSPVYELQNTTHSILFENYNITSNSTAFISYNGTRYNASINHTNTSYVRFELNHTTPFIYANNTGIVFHWNYTLNNSNGTVTNAITANYTQNLLWNLSKYARVNITAYDLITAGAINNFSINSSNLTISTTTGEVYFYHSINESLNLSIDAAGFEISTASIPFIIGNLTNYTFDLYTTNSINFTFRDEETGAIVNNVSVQLISNVSAYNYTTTNGTLYVDLLSPATYAIRYAGNDSGTFYDERFYYFSLQNRTYNNLTLYLLANTSATDVTATVYDEGNHLIEDVYIKVLRYDLATNSYIIQEIGLTNWEGQATLHLVLNDEFYRFIIEYPLGTVRDITSPTYITSTSINFQILLGEDVLEDYYNYLDVTYSLVFNNATNNFRLTYTDANNLLARVCLNVSLISPVNGETPYNTSCVNAATGTILLNVVNTTGTTYLAEAYAYWDLDDPKFLASLYQTFETGNIAGNYGVFLIIIMMIVFVFVGYWSKATALVLTPLPLFFGSILNIIDLSIAVTIPITIVCWIVALWLAKN